MQQSTTQPASAAQHAHRPPVLTWLTQSRWGAVCWVVGSIILLVAIIAEFGWWGLTATTTSYAGAHFNQGRNATWLAHTWVGDYHTDADYAALADRLRHEQIMYVYAHVGPLNDDGTIPASITSYAMTFVRALHQRDPAVRILAWIGQVYDPGAVPGDNAVDIGLPTMRASITNTAALFTGHYGFDGIHYDFEPVPNNDNHFLDLLDETRQAIGQSKLLSVATPNWVPLSHITDALHAVIDRGNAWWTTYYYLAVSSHVDQIVVMMYNTDMATAPLYEMIVEQETAHVLRAVERGSASTQVIVGIPTFQGDSRAFHSSAENMRTGLTGVIGGLNYGTYHTAFGGVAIYPEWLTTDSDWATYNQMWLGESGG
jgi:hypothetical protein